MNRRQFLIASGAGLIAGPFSVSAQQGGERVVVAGAGLAGLSVALELAKSGYRVTVVEGRTRAGGRIHTIGDAFAEGRYVEAGGESAGSGYQRFFGYASQLGVAVEEVEADAPRISTLMKGVVFRPDRQGAHPYSLAGEEAALSPPALLSKHLRAMGEEAGADPARLRYYDGLSLGEALRARGVSRQAIELIEISLNYNDIETVSTAGVLWDLRRRGRGGGLLKRIRGGNGRLTDAMAAAARRAGAVFIYGATVMRVDHSAQGVRVGVQKTGGARETIEAERFVSTIPAAVLRDLIFDPALPEAKSRAIRGLAYTAITKIFLQGRRDFWDAAGFGSTLWTDTPAERIFAVGGETGDPRAVFTMWLDGKGAALPDSLAEQERVQWGLKTFSSVVPGAAGKLEGGISVSWANDPFARGAYAHLLKGQFTTLHQHLAPPAGRLHFAGEHTAENNSGMEGALESAARVVEEIRSK